MAFIHLVLLYMGDIYSFGIIVHMGGIYSFGLIFHGWHLFIWCYFTWVAFIHLDLLYIGGIYSFGRVVHGWHLFILT